MTGDLIIEVESGIAQVILNRPQALNALTLDMIRDVMTALENWEGNNAIRAVVISGNGRAFCAGGDIKTAYHDGRRELAGVAPDELPARYFAEEYLLDRRLFRYRKPVIAYMDGITMGGGYGIAGACRFRVATENTVFAMPEVGIGFFPDVGSAYYLNQCPRALGNYLALTGNSIHTVDIMQAGLATHNIPTNSWTSCLARLIAGAELMETLAAYHQTPADDAGSIFVDECDTIEECFKQPTVAAILTALRNNETDFAHAAAATLFSRSPLSLRVTHEHLLQARDEDFETVIARDFILAQHFLAGHDFYEGVRAAVIDKDRQPRWSPARLTDVADSDVAAYFAAAKYNLHDFSSLRPASERL